MAITIVATAGAPNANSYATLAEANAYHDGHTSAAIWTNAGTDDRNRALVTATRLLDEHVDWSGEVATEEQALLWPRSSMYYTNGFPIPNDEVPQKLKEATAELARQLLAADRMADDKVSTQGIKKLAVGSVDLEFTGYARAKVIPDAVYYMIQQWGTIRNRCSVNVKLVRA